MKITMEWLREKDACDEGKEWFKERGKADMFELITQLKKVNLSWCNWLVIRLLSREDCIRYAIFAAEQVISIYEKEYPKDDRPRKAIEAAKEYLNNPSEENKNAAYAAYAAANAAYAAAYSAKKKLQIKIINYGVKLLKHGGDKV